jgi:hypothetical protein
MHVQRHHERQERIRSDKRYAKKVYGIPTIPYNSANASQTLTNVLSHIAEYRYFEGVPNRIPYPYFQLGW